MTPLSRRLRGHVYRTLASRGTAPRADELAGVMAADSEDVRRALRGLADAHALILDTRGEVEWALPFSAVPTPYAVTDGAVTWHTPCAWDALALGPLLGRATQVDARCPDCADALRVDVTPSAATLVGQASDRAVVHFARAARDWWADIHET